MIVIDDGSDHGTIEGTIGGGAVEHRVRLRAREVMTTLQPELVEVALGQQLGMCCGLVRGMSAQRSRPWPTAPTSM
jgi:xanthine/CO dehydrogenase XdhC/CoxF family maturation factor